MALTHCIAIEPKESKSRGSLWIHVYEHGMTSIEISRLKINERLNLLISREIIKKLLKFFYLWAWPLICIPEGKLIPINAFQEGFAMFFKTVNVSGHERGRNLQVLVWINERTCIDSIKPVNVVNCHRIMKEIFCRKLLLTKLRGYSFSRLWIPTHLETTIQTSNHNPQDFSFDHSRTKRGLHIGSFRDRQSLLSEYAFQSKLLQF